MCTAITLKTNNYYMGRTLDLEYNYNESVIFTPRKFPITYKYLNEDSNHFSILGIGIIIDNYPLYYDACNEHGVCITSLNLPLSTNYSDYNNDKINITSYELILYLLSNFKNLNEIKNILSYINITNDSFNNDYPVSKLHYLISYENDSIVLEIVNGIINIYENKIGVLTNEPQFSFHLSNLQNYSNLSNKSFKTSFNQISGQKSSFKGSGLLGMPGDYLSSSRFIRGTFVKTHFISDNNNISELFNVFNTVFEINGLNITSDDKIYKTIYISLYDLSNKILYFKTYNNYQIFCVNINNFNQNEKALISKTIFLKEIINCLF